MDCRQKVLILVSDSNGCYPVPASKGGAVSTLVESLIERNEKERLVEFEVLSYWDKKAEKLSYKYPHTKFYWVKVPTIINVFDKTIFTLISKFTNKKATSFLSITALLWYIWKAHRLLKEKHYDIVVLEHNILQIWALRLACYKGKYYYHLHNLPRINANSKKWFWRCNKVMCVSQYMVKDIESDHNPIGPVPKGHGIALYNCININQFKPISPLALSNWKKLFNISANDHVLIFAGRLTWEKGIDKILEALDYIQTEDIVLLIVGSLMMSNDHHDEYYNKLKDLSKKHYEKVKFTGYVNHNDLQNVYNIADIAVLPSMWDEPAGLTMIEAMACGIPTITTFSGGIPEYVGDAAIVLERNKELPKEIALWVDTLLGDKELYSAYSKRGRERIMNSFSLDSYLQKFADCIGVV